MDSILTFWSSLPPGKLLIILVLLAIPILPNLWSIWHAFHRDFATVQEKMAWVMAATFVPVLGGIAYILFGRPRSRPIAPWPDKQPQSQGKDDS